jgi:basic amino acid/polyamine antiporter, APA family
MPAVPESRTPNPEPRVFLARKLRTVDYFTLGFGTMVGAGWLVVMDDWLQRGGPLGAILGFALGGALLLPIGYIYGRMVMAMPDAASEIAYTGAVFPPGVSFATGWMMILAYLPVCPWEAVAVGKIAAYVFPSLNSLELYRVAGKPVYLPHIIMGLALTAVVTALNYRGIRLTATFHNWMTYGLLAMATVFVWCGFARGSPANLKPLFSHRGWMSVLLVIQIVPYYMTGFESVPKCAEEASPEFRRRGFFRAILLAVGVGIVFYTAVIAAVALVHPWPALANTRFATAVAFESAFRTYWLVNLILAAALVSLVKIFNGNFIAATRLLFALGRRRFVNPRFAGIHATNLTPSVAVVCTGLATAAAALFGESILIPISEVGSMASAVGWLATCIVYFRLERASRERAISTAGAIVGSLLIVMKLLPVVPGSFTGYEYLGLALWILLGWALRRRSTAPADVG